MQKEKYEGETESETERASQKYAIIVNSMKDSNYNLLWARDVPHIGQWNASFSFLMKRGRMVCGRCHK